MPRPHWRWCPPSISPALAGKRSDPPAVSGGRGIRATSKDPSIARFDEDLQNLQFWIQFRILGCCDSRGGENMGTSGGGGVVVKSGAGKKLGTDGETEKNGGGTEYMGTSGGAGVTKGKPGLGGVTHGKTGRGPFCGGGERSNGGGKIMAGE
ncbi:hypothetical protein DM860_016789 [Cuscuta australis]|uniref:Uncharacterized protein n=1 Tax=Cuscuta australis TaxID=267555 RepID=A0A328E0Q7_9ASTE|nr:hypothetical protein DM860_016789 [Cuscuta australis]